MVGKTIRYCPNCGKPVDLEAKFCPNCGYKLVTPNALTTNTFQTSEEPTGLAIGALILAILGFIVPILGIIGMIMGIIDRSKHKNGINLAAIIIGIITIILWFIVGFFFGMLFTLPFMAIAGH